MASGKLLRQLIKTGIEGNIEAFRRVSEEIIREERRKHHHLLANDLEKILYGRPQNLPRNYLQPPKDKDRGLPLIHILQPTRRLEDVVLSDENFSIIEEILKEYHYEERLRSYGLVPTNRLLFCGPPGCGKTLTAEVIASELGRPFGIVRIDSVVSSLLGETAANLRKIFDYISNIPMVVLFDEFDALAKERADQTEHGEIKRVVNATLQMLDDYRGRSLLIAATNHEMILDIAIWRRFEEVLVFDRPNIEQIRRLLEIKLRGVRRDFDISDTNIVYKFKGLSHADIERILRRAVKQMILSGEEFLKERHIIAALQREEARQKRIKQG